MLQAFWLSILGASQLTVVSETPDALCPPLEKAQSAVAARVGKVSGGPFVAKYAVVRDPARGQKALRLVLTGATGELLLERKIALSAGDCGVAAQTLALILEGYFDGVSTSEQGVVEGESNEPSPALKQEGTGETPSEPSPPEGGKPQTPAHPETPHGSPEPEVADGARPSSNSIRLGAGVSAGRLGAVGLGWNYRFGPSIDGGMDVVVPLTAHRSTQQQAQLKLYTASLYVGGRWVFPLFGRDGASEWTSSLGVGPLLGLHLQRLLVGGETVDAGVSGLRVVPSAGAQAQLSLEWTRSWGLDFAVRAVGLFGGRSFVIREVDGSASTVSALPQLNGDMMISLRYWL